MSVSTKRKRESNENDNKNVKLFVTPNKTYSSRPIPFKQIDLNSKLPKVEICHFSEIPREIREVLFSILTPNDLYKLSLTSHEYYGYVNDFLRSSMGLVYLKAFLSNKNTTKSTVISDDRIKSIGRLYRLLTCLETINRRIQVYKDVLFIKLHLLPGKEIEDVRSAGRFLSEAIATWPERDLEILYSQFDHHLLLKKKIEQFYTSKEVGTEPELEMDIRSCFRLMYFDSIQISYIRGCFLNLILRNRPIWFQARLFLNLFGSVTQGKIDWQMFNRDRINQHPSIDEEQVYFDMSRGFRVLDFSSQSKKLWNSNSKLALFTELTTQPSAWSLEYKAELLFYCTSELLSNTLIAYATKGYFHDYGNLIQALTLASRQNIQRYRMIQTGVNQSFERLPLLSQRNVVLQHINYAFRSTASRLLEQLQTPGMRPAEYRRCLQLLEYYDGHKVALMSFLFTNNYISSN